MSGKSFTVITTHYGDQFWVDLLVKQIHNEGQIKEILIAQNYSSSEIKSGWTSPYSTHEDYPKVKVLTKENEYPEHASKQHTDLLNWTTQNHLFLGEFVVFFDSDCFPVDVNWLTKVDELLNDYEAILSMNPTSRFSVHVCFLVIKSEILKEVNFNFERHTTVRDGNKFELRKETGSDLAFILSRKKHKIYLLEPEYIFGRLGTTTYLGGKIVHIGGQSFINRSDIKRNREEFYEYISFQLPKKLALSVIEKPKYLRKGSRYLFLTFLIKKKIPFKVVVQAVQTLFLNKIFRRY